jgi:hypothetical protein
MLKSMGYNPGQMKSSARNQTLQQKKKLLESSRNQMMQNQSTSTQNTNSLRQKQMSVVAKRAKGALPVKSSPFQKQYSQAKTAVNRKTMLRKTKSIGALKKY